MVFVEASHFSKHLPRYLADEEYRLLQKFLAEVKVRVPAGVSDGQRIRVKGRGAAGARRAPIQEAPTPTTSVHLAHAL